MELLKRVAFGTVDELSPEAVKPLGISQGQKLIWYMSPEVRACALREIGETGLAGAVDFLEKFRLSDAEEDLRGQISQAAQVALRRARMLRIADPTARTAFLRAVLAEPADRLTSLAVWHWAAEALCEIGDWPALAHIQSAYKRYWSGGYGEEMAQYCEDRMRVVVRDPIRARALGTVFDDLIRLQGSKAGKRLIDWATFGLAVDKSPEAVAEWRRVSSELEGLGKAFPGDERLGELVRRIAELRNYSAK